MVRLCETDVGAFSVFERFVILVGDGFNNLHARRNVLSKLRDERFSINLIPDHRIGWHEQEQEEEEEEVRERPINKEASLFRLNEAVGVLNKLDFF